MLPEAGHPSNDSVYLTTAVDGLNFSQSTGPLFQKASSPEAIRLRKPLGTFNAGDVLLYFVDFSEWHEPKDQEFVSVARSNDGKVFGAKERLHFKNAPERFKATDPSVVELAGGGLRIYLMTPGPDRHIRNILSATSQDGINFVVEPGVRYQTRGSVDVFNHDGEWLMLFADESNNTTNMAISADGLAWQPSDLNRPIDGVATSFVENSPSLKLYSNFQGITFWSLDQSQRTPTPIAPISLPISGIFGDPSAVIMNDSTWLYYKFRAQP